jgi:hypothetical protein
LILPFVGKFIALALFAVVGPAYAETIDCRLLVKGAEVLNGPCEYTSTGENGSFSIASPGGEILAELNVTAKGVADAAWNGGKSSGKADLSLGVAVLIGACWANGNVKLCLTR